MIYQKDWLMRQIESMIAAIMHFLFHAGENTEATSEMQQNLNEQIDDYLINGDICGAEDWLFENLNTSDTKWLMSDWLNPLNDGQQILMAACSDMSFSLVSNHLQ